MNNQSFKHIIIDISEVCKTMPSLDKIVDCILTLNNRFPLQLGKKSLSFSQKAILEVLSHKPVDFFNELDDEKNSSSLHCYFGIKIYGRIILARSLPSLDDGDVVLGRVTLNSNELENIRSLEDQFKKIEIPFNQKANNTFIYANETDIKNMICTVESMVDHIDPILIYTNEKVFTLFGKHNTVLNRGSSEKNFLIERLSDLAPNQWEPEERYFIFCMNLLKRAGLRGEEFNGLQLTPYTLHCHFNNIIQKYCDTLGTIPEEKNSLEEKAQYLNILKENIKKSYVIFRWVNGLNFYKEERWFSKESVKINSDFFPEKLNSIFSDKPDEKDIYAVFFDWLSKSLSSNTEIEFDLHPIETVIHKIVEISVDSLQADIGMTRGLRSLMRLKNAVDSQNTAQACDWPVSDYFCCVVPSQDLIQTMRDKGKLLFSITNAIAKRMEYNSWHYMPGHFPANEIPAERHFYIPPGMPDTAEWSNQHHAGHILANVLYSIRSPAPLKYNNRIFPGMIDIRLMRKSGNPFSEKELKQAVKFTTLIQLFYQALFDVTVERGIEFKIESFTKNWYEKKYSF